MCRFVAYRGFELPLHDLLYDAAHGLYEQSQHPAEAMRYAPTSGWGVGWYPPHRDRPALYRSTLTLWSDARFPRMAHALPAHGAVATVRGTDEPFSVERPNSHPFQGGHRVRDGHEEGQGEVERGRRRLLFTHNGRLGAPHTVKDRIRRELPQDIYRGIEGTTDSEHIFGLVQRHLGRDAADPTAEDLARALEAALTDVQRIQHEAGERFAQANLLLTDGERMAATRYADPPEAWSHRLHVARARRIEMEGGTLHAVDPGEGEAVVLASERLFEDGDVWEEVPRGSLVTVDDGGNVEVEELEVP